MSPTLIGALSSLRVVLLGWFPVPEQTSPEHAQNLFADEAQDTLDAVTSQFEKAGNTEVATRLIFTRDKFDTLTRVSTEEACDGVLIPGAMGAMRRVLVPLRGLHNAERIAPFVADLIQDHTTDVTLFHILEEDETEDSSLTNVLEPAAEMMKEHGIDAGLLQLEARAADDPTDTIVERSTEYDLVVLGETKPSIRSILFGTVPEQIVKTADIPVIVVRHEDPSITSAEKATQAAST